MKIKTKTYPDYKTVRQWAEEGFLPKKGARSIKLWSNGYCNRWFRYYRPDQVEAATQEQLDAFFAKERQRKKARKQQREAEHNAVTVKADVAKEVAQNYDDKIAELHEIIKFLVTKYRPKRGKDVDFLVLADTTGSDQKHDAIVRLFIYGTDQTLYFDCFEPAAKLVEELPKINTILARAGAIVGKDQNNLDFLAYNGIVIPANAKIYFISALTD